MRGVTQNRRMEKSRKPTHRFSICPKHPNKRPIVPASHYVAQLWSKNLSNTLSSKVGVTLEWGIQDPKHVCPRKITNMMIRKNNPFYRLDWSIWKDDISWSTNRKVHYPSALHYPFLSFPFPYLLFLFSFSFPFPCARVNGTSLAMCRYYKNSLDKAVAMKMFTQKLPSPFDP